VTTDMHSRIENFKAGETLLQQIKFLLAESGTRETPTVKTSRYEIDFPSVPGQGTCDLSPLTSSEWVPVVDCQGEAAAVANVPRRNMRLEASSQTGVVVRGLNSDMTFGNHPVSIVDGFAAWDLDATYLQRNDGGAAVSVGQFYTQCAWIKWRKTDSGWRTLFRGDKGHSALVKAGTTELGMYSNVNGGWRKSGFHITADEWQFVCVVGEGESAVTKLGTSKFYVGDLKKPPVFVGQADRVVCGSTIYRIGWPRQGPGKLASFTAWNKALTLEQLQDVYSQPKKAER